MLLRGNKHINNNSYSERVRFNNKPYSASASLIPNNRQRKAENERAARCKRDTAWSIASNEALKTYKNVRVLLLQGDRSACGLAEQKNGISLPSDLDNGSSPPHFLNQLLQS